MEISRRDFVRMLSGLSATSVLGFTMTGCAPNVPEGEQQVSSWHKAPCRFCGTGCGVLAGVDKGRLVALKGDPESPVNRGLLCVKGYHLPLILYGADRLTRPRIRKNGKLVEASWEEALDLVASRFKAVLDQHGPDAVAFYGSGQWTVQEGYAASKFMRVGLGSNNVEANARLCMASAVTGFMTTFGMDEPMGCYDDLDLADAFVLWGSNMAEMHPMLWARIQANRNRHDWVRIIDVTVRRSMTSQESDEVVVFRPQSDLALANGIAHLLIKSGRVDRKFVDAHTVFKRGKVDIGYGVEDGFQFKDEAEPITFEQYARFVADYPPEKVEEISGVPVAQIEKLADLYGDPDKKVVSLWTMGMNQHSRGTWINNLVYNLHLLTGKICKPGSNPMSLTGQPSACGTVREVGTLAHRLPADMVVTDPEHRKKAAEIWKVPVEKIPDKPGKHTVDMFRALAKGDIKAIWVQVTNPFQTMPNLPRYQPGYERDDTFLVVSDVYPTVTTEVADVVLPSALWVEKEGVFGNTERRTQQWNQLVPPPGEAKPDLWQIVEVARRMGHGNLFEFGSTPLEEGLFEEYRQFGLGHGHDLAPYKTYKEVRGLRWPVVNGKETRYRYLEGEDPYVPKGAGVRFYGNKKTGGRAVIWARPYEPAAEPPDEEFPFWLCTGRVLEHWHTGTMTRRVPQLHKAMPRAFVELHPDDAARLGVGDGDAVRLVSRRGKLELPASVNGRGVPQQGLVFVPFFQEEKLINLLTLDDYCPISKQPDYKKCAVRVEKVG